jgi:anthranilate synthase component 2
MFLLIDNYDSFTYNLVQVLAEAGTVPRVLRNDEEALLHPDLFRELTGVLISPGPGGPEKSGLCRDFLSRLHPEIPVLGVCLGQQILGHIAGWRVIRAERIMHGKTSRIRHNGDELFSGMSEAFTATRYHSLLLDPAQNGEKLPEITAWTEEGEIMGIRYTDRPWMGVQFHPESVLSEEGPLLLGNFLRIVQSLNQKRRQ